MAIIKKIGESGLLTNPLLTQYTNPNTAGNLTTWGDGLQTQPNDAESSLTTTDIPTITATRTYWPELLAISGAVGYMLDPKRANLYGFFVVAGIGTRLITSLILKKNG